MEVFEFLLKFLWNMQRRWQKAIFSSLIACRWRVDKLLTKPTMTHWRIYAPPAPDNLRCCGGRNKYMDMADGISWFRRCHYVSMPLFQRWFSWPLSVKATPGCRFNIKTIFTDIKNPNLKIYDDYEFILSLFQGFSYWYNDIFIMMTSSNGNIFRVTGHLCGEFTGPRWIPHTKASDAELWCFLSSASE